MTIEEKYALWLEKATEDADLQTELKAVAGQPKEIRDRFYKELEFGTGGLRGVIGAGDNRMNVYTVRKATQGLADFLRAQYTGSSVAISFDSRIKSERFAAEAARVLAGSGIRVYLFRQLEPTPVLSYAVRFFGCKAGIMVTASHNPAKYNGYKCYGPDGCQMTDHDAAAVTEYIHKVDLFSGVTVADYDQAVADGRIRMIGDDLLESYLQQVQRQQVNAGICAGAGLSVIYTPLNGTGNLPVREIFRRIGIQDVTVVPEQEMPDGHFPTAPFPNPEIREAFGCALKLAEKKPADLLLATDPDCDRVGIAVKDGNGYTLLSGNEVGCLLLDYVLSCRKTNGTLPEKPVVIKTIVTTEMARAIADKYGCEMRNLLTGFKYIGEQIGLLEKQGEADRYVLGFEESYGYLAGSYVRDKDAVVASMLIAEMAVFYRLRGKTLLQRMEELYTEYGFYRNTLVNVAFEGEQGMLAMQQLMTGLRENRPAEIGGCRVIGFTDYLESRSEDLLTGKTKEITLPKSNVVAFVLEGNAGVIVRPSGTEPKVKGYVTACGKDRATAEALNDRLQKAAEKLLKGN